ncbi:hypothetical protein ACFL5H_03285 [Candidatus Latescibacterota bacterium]
MYRGNFKLWSAFILVILLAIGCASVNYIGKYSDQTTSVDVYYSMEEIEKEYIVLGHAIGSGILGASNEKIQNKLIEEAKLKGADAIVITGIGITHVPFGEGSSTEENQINASFIEYK